MSKELALINELREHPTARLISTTKEAADTIEQLIRERDEARAERDEANYQIGWLGPDAMVRENEKRVAEAEAAGYRRGVEDAANVAWHLNGWGEDFGRGGHAEHIQSCILALLEQTGAMK